MDNDIRDKVLCPMIRGTDTGEQYWMLQVQPQELFLSVRVRVLIGVSVVAGKSQTTRFAWKTEGWDWAVHAHRPISDNTSILHAIISENEF